MNRDAFIQSFQHVITTGLPGESAHSLLMPINRPFTSKALEYAENIRHSAVGILLYPHETSTHCILIQRPNYAGVHGNQVSFPGGKMDPEDPSLEHTARRECYEEVNFPMDQGTLIGNLSEVYIPVSNFLVRPYVFYTQELPELIPDNREVEAIISFDLFDLTRDEIIKTTDIQLQQGFVRKNVPYFDIEGNVVWGATAMMLAEMREILKRF